MPSKGIGGVAASQGVVIVSGRNVTDNSDLFHCFETATGKQRWKFRQFAPGNLDYGNSPRATPLLNGKHVWLAGALGNLACLNLSDGKVIWKKNITFEFESPELTWGHAGSPLLVDNKLIIQPGGPETAIVALEPLTGKVIWETPGSPPGYSSLISATINGSNQIIGYEKEQLAGWSLETGKQLWTMQPPYSGDFNVPTPIFHDGKLFVATENNGARLYGFNKQNKLIEEPLMEFTDLAPDSHSPIITNNRLFGIWDGLFCLDLKQNLKQLWLDEDKVFGNYVSLVSDNRQVLAITMRSELILFPVNAADLSQASRLKLTSQRTDTYAHPAFFEKSLFIRINKELCCFDLSK